MRRRSKKQEAGAGFSLFSYLDGLLCTMGALIIVLICISRGARFSHKSGEGEQPAGPTATELADELRNTEWRTKHMVAAREKTLKDLQDARLQLSHIEDHEKRLRKQLENLVAAEKALASGEPNATDARLRSDVEQLRKALAQAQADVDEARKRAESRKPSYAIVPYQGPNQTRRRPIYVECTGERVILQPEGIELTPNDFAGPMGAGNPLAAALRAEREYLYEQNDANHLQEEPYPLLLIRPDGIDAYCAAREAMSSWSSDFGYELIDQDWKLEYQPPNQELAELARSVVNEARKRQQFLARSMPRQANQEQWYRAKPSGGGVAPEGGFAGGTGGSGRGGRGGRRDPASNFAQRGSQAGQRGGGLGDGAGRGTGVGNGANGHGENGDSGGGGGYGPGGAGRAGAYVNGDGDPNGPNPYAGIANGIGGGPAGAASNGTGTGGQGSGGPGGQPGAQTGRPGLAGAAGANGTGGAGTGGPELAKNGVTGPGGTKPGGTANSATGGAGDGTGPELGGPNGGSPNGQSGGAQSTAGGPGGAGQSGNSNGSAGGAGGAGGQASGQSGGAQSAAAGGSTTPGGSGSAGGTGAAGGGMPNLQFGQQPQSTGPQSSGVTNRPNGSGAAGSTSSSGGSSAGSAQSSIASQQGKDWALPEESRHAVPIARPVVVECRADKLVVHADGATSKVVKEIPMPGATADSINELVGTVSEQAATWGPAGRGMYWKPSLSMQVAPGGEARYADLQKLMDNSGLDVRPAQAPPKQVAKPKRWFGLVK